MWMNAKVPSRNARCSSSGMTHSPSALDSILPTPRLVEVDSVDLGVPPEQAWELIRHSDLGRSPLVRALFAMRTLPSRLSGQEVEEMSLRLDDFESSPERPGFQVLHEAPPHEIVVGAIGKVWQLDIPFVHVRGTHAFAAFRERGFVKVAWAIRLSRLGERDTHVAIEVRVDATDDDSWRKFCRYFRVIGPGSRFIRRSVLAALAREHGTPESKETERPLPGDELLADAIAQVTNGITIQASPEAIWPWLVQMGCRRAGFYTINTLDNGGVRSAREIHPELQDLHVGDRLPATPKGEDGFDVLRLERSRVLVLGGLYDAARKRQIPFAGPRPERFWQVTWAFVLERLGDRTTRLHVRVRAASPSMGRIHRVWIGQVHRLMEAIQLQNLAARAEGRLPSDDWHDVAEGMRGAVVIACAMATPFLRGKRSHWGVDTAAAQRLYPGDELVPEPRWAWTHGVEIEASMAEVWPWIAQVGADRAGFYSYQWLENLAGCNIRNAESLHPAWEVCVGASLKLHPSAAPLRVVRVEPGRFFVARAEADPTARASGKSWIEATWLFFLEPLGAKRSRFISRYRCACSEDIVTRIQFGPTLLEPIGFAMDRRMLLGVRKRVDRMAPNLARSKPPQALRGEGRPCDSR